jgi:dimeric dUTPase (all-alpha-NTP-PPase superfamily)
MTALELILNSQRELQKKHFKTDISALDEEQRAQYIKDMSLALTDELHEALNETGWKPWATSRHFNREAFLGEMIDVLHFWANLVLLTNVGEREILDLYCAKAEKNARRQMAGYDGVQGKCTTCGRAFDDVAVLCTPIACEHIE